MSVVPGWFPSPDCTEACAVMSVSQSENTGGIKLPIFLIITDDAHRALFLDLHSRREQEGVTCVCEI